MQLLMFTVLNYFVPFDNLLTLSFVCIADALLKLAFHQVCSLC